MVGRDAGALDWRRRIGIDLVGSLKCEVLLTFKIQSEATVCPATIFVLYIARISRSEQQFLVRLAHVAHVALETCPILGTNAKCNGLI